MIIEQYKSINNFRKQKIRMAIKEILRDFKKFPDKYLTESDVCCFFVNELMKTPEFRDPKSTEDNSLSVPIHTEVRWYGQSGKLKWRSDVVIIDVSTLRVKNGYLKLPSKGFTFNKPISIIEIKFRRINGETDNSFIKKLQMDFNKLKKIKTELRGDYHSYLLVLDKKNNIETDIKNYLRVSNEITVFYKFARL